MANAYRIEPLYEAKDELWEITVTIGDEKHNIGFANNKEFAYMRLCDFLIGEIERLRKTVGQMGS